MFAKKKDMHEICVFCGQFCFVKFPERTPNYVILAYNETAKKMLDEGVQFQGVNAMATCFEGQRAEKEACGYCYEDVIAMCQVPNDPTSAYAGDNQPALTRFDFGDIINMGGWVELNRPLIYFEPVFSDQEERRTWDEIKSDLVGYVYKVFVPELMLSLKVVDVDYPKNKAFIEIWAKDKIINKSEEIFDARTSIQGSVTSLIDLERAING